MNEALTRQPVPSAPGPLWVSSDSLPLVTPTRAPSLIVWMATCGPSTLLPSAVTSLRIEDPARWLCARHLHRRPSPTPCPRLPGFAAGREMGPRPRRGDGAPDQSFHSQADRGRDGPRGPPLPRSILLAMFPVTVDYCAKTTGTPQSGNVSAADRDRGRLNPAHLLAPCSTK